MNNWQIIPQTELSIEFLQLVQKYAPNSGQFLAQILWQRGIKSPEQLAGFLNPDLYKPANCWEFGDEINLAILRLQKARENQEIICIWGDFDADGITSTAVLWEGLGQFFSQNESLFYYIPDRLTESHGLNQNGIDQLIAKNVKLIVTCDTGSTNINEIEYAKNLGIDIIITDHHTLPEKRPDVTAIINPRYLSIDHQLYHLSGVGVAYQLMEGLYQTLPDIPHNSLEDLLDLVAIGLIADLVKLTGDCRYLAQKGMAKLSNSTRPGIRKMLDFCKKTGDRPTDISFGIGPRINAVSRIYGDGSFCVQLLTSQDEKSCKKLAEQAEFANSRRKFLQKNIIAQVQQKIAEIDLSTTSVIVLCDDQWPPGILGLVAGQIAQEYERPTILLSTEGDDSNDKIAKGSARSVNDIDLYHLIFSQRYLLEKFGGHPLAAGLSIKEENIPVFTDAINQQLRKISLVNGGLILPSLKVDLVVKVKDLGIDLYRELKYLEPCGMGNHTPKLLIKNCWFDNSKHKNIEDFKGRKVTYIRTTFEICDDSAKNYGFEGIWWGHYEYELPRSKCDAVVELDYNNKTGNTQVRLIAVNPISEVKFEVVNQPDLIVDWRGNIQDESNVKWVLKEYPNNWEELRSWLKKQPKKEKLAIAYPPPNDLSPGEIWLQLIGMAKYLSRTGKLVSIEQIKQKLQVSDRAVLLGLNALNDVGFEVMGDDWEIEIFLQGNTDIILDKKDSINLFLNTVREEQFYQRYFYEMPLSMIQGILFNEQLTMNN